MPLQVGYTQQIITPSLDKSVYLAGFGRNRRAQSVHDDLFVRAMALQSDGPLLIIVALDLISLHREQCQEIERNVKSQLPDVQMLIACTHTHHGPDTLGLWGPDEQTSGVDEAYLKHLQRCVVETAVASAAHMQEAHLASASIIVPGVAVNMRDPHIRDEELTCLQFCTVEDEQPLLTWLIFPCHPEVLWDQNTHITSDYMYSLRERVEAETGASCLTHVGALGGMMTPNVEKHSFTEAFEMGETLAEAALTTLAGQRAVDVTHLNYTRQEFGLPLVNPLFKMAAAIGLLPSIERGDGTILTEASLLMLDDLLLFAVPGELLPKLGLQYRQMMKEAGAHITAVIGLANDELGYILPKEDFSTPENYLDPGSSYEESMSVGPEIGPRLTESLVKLLAAS
ncbi:MAG: hypothetical protein JSV68_22105 [Anaerolineaceae bacterium]|nr:MAG: hypothetical protein JSV68_22105 [Anaerolineaceae bacterium]